MSEEITETKNENPGIILSIPIIVGKEEANLKRCLDSLLPIIHEPWCELIVVCTQPGDRTEEVARSYTDKVFVQPWQNDFSFHRNFANSHATGKYIFTIDADEELPQRHVYRLQDYILNPKYEAVNTLFIMQRNFQDKAKKVFSEILMPRIFKRVPGRDIYSGCVHNKPICDEPYYFANEICLNHYGYIWEGTTLQQEKTERSLPLLEREYKEKPDDLHILTHLIKTLYTISKFDLVIQYSEKWIEKMNVILARGDYHAGWFAYLEVFVDLVNSYLAKDDEANARRIIDEAEKFSKRLMVIYFAFGEYLLNKDRTEEAITWLERGIEVAKEVGDPYEALLSDYGKMKIPEVLYLLAVEYLVLFEDEKAGEYLNQAVKLNNNRIPLRYDLWNEERVKKVRMLKIDEIRISKKKYGEILA